MNKVERKEIEEILDRRANEIAGFLDDYRKIKDYYGSVELALSREINRLRNLADKVAPKLKEEMGE